MAVVVTRPDPEGSELCNTLLSKNIVAYHFPLIEFYQGSSTASLPTDLESADLIIAVSKQAVLWADKILQAEQKKWPVDKTYLAIGQKTAEKLSHVTDQKVHYPETSDSEHFLSLSVLQNLNGKRVVILRGNGGRELIYSTLVTRGASVVYCEVYQRHKLTFDGRRALLDWQRNNVTHIVITSGEQLEHLLAKMPASEWLTHQTVIVPSKRIACLAQEFGFLKILVSGSASNPDLLAAILPQCMTGQAHDK